MISLSEARALSRELGHPLAPVRVRLREAVGAVLAETVVSEGPVPAFANSAMDGYAVRSADTAGAPVELVEAGMVGAGALIADLPFVGEGQAVRIMTGAPIPPGADAVVMVERTAPAGQGRVRIDEAATPGRFVRPAGSDLGAEAVVAAPGTALTPAHAGLLAAAGRAEVLVHRRPRVGVLSTGDELLDPPAPLVPGRIRDANRPMLLAAVALSAAVPVDLGAVADRATALDEALLDAAARCDLILTSGGVSMGDHDLVRARLTPYQVAIKPAKPLALGIIEGTPVVGLPGNPVSALVSFELFARPLVRRFAGYGDGALDRPVLRASAPEGISREPDGKTHFVRVEVTSGEHGELVARTAGQQHSHVLSGLAAGGALAVVPDGEGVGPGGTVGVMLLT